jgi:hypothetical protein
MEPDRRTIEDVLRLSEKEKEYTEVSRFIDLFRD